LICQGLIQYNFGKYELSLKNFKKALEENPLAPPVLRYAIGLCYHRLGNMDKARFSFERLLELEPDSSKARVGLGILEMQSFEDKASLARALKLFSEAFEFDKKNPLCIRSLADHFFKTEQYDKAEKFAEAGFKLIEGVHRPATSEREDFRRDMELLKADFQFILGKIKHVRKEFEGALDHYTKAVNLNPQRYAAHFNLAKVHF